MGPVDLQVGEIVDAQTLSPDEILACSQCFFDAGLRLDAEQGGVDKTEPCPQCGSASGKALSRAVLGKLAYRYFVWGSLRRPRFGGAPTVQMNQHHGIEIEVASWLQSDTELLAKLLGVGFFYYGPRTWMIGENEPLKALFRRSTGAEIVKRILNEYPVVELPAETIIYRIRKNVQGTFGFPQFDSPPDAACGRGRLDSWDLPVLYGSSDLELCIHECRVTAEDHCFVAELRAVKSLRVLDVSRILKEEKVTEFESLDIAINMLFLAGKYSYRITRRLAKEAFRAGFDGLIYPSFFSLLRQGAMPFETTYGISHRRFEPMHQYEQWKVVPNVGLFGRPISDGRVTVRSVDRLMLTRVKYDYHFGPILGVSQLEAHRKGFDAKMQAIAKRFRGDDVVDSSGPAATTAV